MSHRATIFRLAAETLLDVRTIGRVISGERVRHSTQRIVEAAAKRLNIKLTKPSTRRDASKESHA